MVNPYDAPRSALRIGEGLRWSASMKGCWYLGLLAPTLFEFLAMTLWLFPAGAHELLFGAGWGIADGVGWAAMCFASSRSVRNQLSCRMAGDQHRLDCGDALVWVATYAPAYCAC